MGKINGLTRIFCLINILTFPLLYAEELDLGIRISATLGQGSGKGVWDWTETEDRGNLYLLPGLGLALQGEYIFPSNLILEAAPGIYLTRAGLRLNDQDFHYRQISLELPLYLKKDLPLGNNNWFTGIGPTLIYLPFQGIREFTDTTGSTSIKVQQRSYSSQQLLFGFSAGLDYLLFKSNSGSSYISIRFNHPFIAPEYRWIPVGSGNFRFNHIDLSFVFLWTEKGKQ